MYLDSKIIYLNCPTSMNDFSSVPVIDVILSCIRRQCINLYVYMWEVGQDPSGPCTATYNTYEYYAYLILTVFTSRPSFLQDPRNSSGR
jgi:hypothetical protein